MIRLVQVWLRSNSESRDSTPNRIERFDSTPNRKIRFDSESNREIRFDSAIPNREIRLRIESRDSIRLRIESRDSIRLRETSCNPYLSGISGFSHRETRAAPYEGTKGDLSPSLSLLRKRCQRCERYPCPERLGISRVATPCLVFNLNLFSSREKRREEDRVSSRISSLLFSREEKRRRESLLESLLFSREEKKRRKIPFGKNLAPRSVSRF